MKLINIIHKLFANRIILLVFIFGLSLRMLNPFYGSPVLYVNGDESSNYMGALYMILNKDPFIKTSIYPPLGSYLQIPFLLLSFIFLFVSKTVNSLQELQIFMISNQGYFLFISRIISGLLGGITVICVYKISLLIFPLQKKIALLSAFLFGLSFNHVQMSNSGRPWSAAIFFFSLSILYSLKSLDKQNKNLKYSVLAGIFCVLAYGCHQVGIFAIWFYILIRLYVNKYNLQKIFKDINLIIVIITVFLGIVFFQYLRTYAPSTEWFSINKSYTNIFEKFVNLLLYNNFFYNLKQIIYTEPVIFIFFLISLFNINHWKRAHVPIHIFTLSVFIIFSLSFIQPRYILPVILIISIYASSEIIYFLVKLKNGPIRILAFIAMIALSSYNTLLWSFKYIQEPTFILATEWIKTNIPKNVVIISTASRFLPFIPSKDVLKIQQKRHPEFNRSIETLLNKGEFPYNVRNIIYIGEVGDISTKENVQNLLDNIPIKFKYLIDIYFDPNNTPLVFIDKNKYIKIYSQSPLFNKNNHLSISNLLATVDTPSLPKLLFLAERTGPYIDIYQVRD